ncbi:4-hydroxythreonine-4-phosphate dehydrogenase PdxA [Roseinatronobacter bogoriensis]|uniref:4-hydroxythreonine-4-phosphate dehydrogenase n=1 Tax=Roseinatronobacter bogoriensis subsp. barguzinensis TaxID=441209 RepID=A0A2K8KHF6_9RHOB|nr:MULTISPECIES: 4-hydroxythreonine-4-phosphate dehydrogenase PdxA [Rhodobaca]ATX66268.1 4-hydroxythreonine-4-phosphate dehydrogenase PdxA [Rhodobaca barguzinensis]MBB4207390.1 4-hydroxythreonine-4-phosphate dehydrogenase [Rhodobaca bogoriensis DSM 18756]TDW40303.1 4-hydroxythreonine-4-phosphate dehydrogenase [Rhodobaca barguzinensis]TDY70545.1 4-hydroxythreonine-4-phosphate dehydrogenase [Rhodobaca bogoriensis DSM 18756]
MTPLIMTCGDPAGIGPEIAVKASQALGAKAGFVWLGDPAHLPDAAQWEFVDAPLEAQHVRPGVMPVLYHKFPALARPGKPDPSNAGAVVEVIARAVKLVQAGAASGIVTCPINKAALQTGAGFGFPGHTEYLADLAGVDRVVMMLVCRELRVVPVTIHIALKDVPGRLTAALLKETLCITRASLIRDFGIAEPKLAVAGLNPHAGESGLMGQEDAEVITPVVERLRQQGMKLSGPLPADTMFHSAARAKYDAAICMYHDQALIPIKTIDFANGVNVTLGLPFIRTSPDHGTAYDIAGQNKADASSLIAAIRLAQDMAERRR